MRMKLRIKFLTKIFLYLIHNSTNKNILFSILKVEIDKLSRIIIIITFNIRLLYYIRFNIKGKLKIMKTSCNNFSTTDSQKELFKKLNSTNTLSEVQTYIEKVLELRGFSSQSVQDKVLLLTEELGELAKAIRKYSPNAFVDHQRLENYDTIESEIADVFIVLVSVANKLNINIFECLKEKEQKNINRVWKINNEVK